jgi:hypothetical protein
MRLRRIERGALTLASAEVKFQIDTETHDPLDIGMLFEWQVFFSYRSKLKNGFNYGENESPVLFP